MSGHWLRHTVDTNVRCMYVVVIDYCRTYAKAVRGGGVKRGDMCYVTHYGMLRAAACGRVGPPRTNVRAGRRGRVARARVHTYAHTYIYIHTCIYMYIYIHIYTHMYIHIYMYICIHIYTHVYIHVCMYMHV